MYRKEFVKKIIYDLSDEKFERLKTILTDKKYIPVYFAVNDAINREFFAEKISDYFEKVELVAGAKKFDELIEKFAESIDDVVRDRIDRKSKNINRARRYYNSTSSMRKSGLKTFEQILDYSRIMLCLYMAVINHGYKDISDFDFASEVLAGKNIMVSLRTEKKSGILGKSRMFDTTAPYGMDRCTFIIVIMMYQYIKNWEQED